MLISGVRVADWSEGLSGPYCARLLSDLGAEVMKVEPAEGDSLRRYGPCWAGGEGTDATALFDYVNAGKRGMTLDLEQAPDRDHFHELLSRASVLVESQPASRLTAFGLELEQLRRRHPHLIILSVTPFGRSGPLAENAATDFTLQHRAGFAYAMARPVEDPEARGPLAGADHEGPLAVGIAGAVAAMWGLLCTQAGMPPTPIDLASHDFYAQLALDGLSEWLRGERTYSRHRERREGTEAAGGLTWILPCAEGWVMVSPREQHQWDRWVALLGNPDWSRDASFCGTRVERRRNWFELQQRMAEWSGRLAPDEVTRQAQDVAVACFPVSTPDTLLRNAQLLHREFFDRLAGPAGQAVDVPGLPFDLVTTGGNRQPRRQKCQRLQPAAAWEIAS